MTFVRTTSKTDVLKSVYFLFQNRAHVNEETKSTMLTNNRYRFAVICFGFVQDFPRSLDSSSGVVPIITTTHSFVILK